MAQTATARRLLNNWNHLPHHLCVDAEFAPADSPARGLKIPKKFKDFNAACDWLEKAEKAGHDRDHFYLTNEYAGDNAGNAMGNGELT